MLHTETALRRLRAQHLIGTPDALPLAAATWMGAIQAQDYGQALWAIGSRTADARAAQVEQAVVDAQILRTWTMRGTIHVVPARDANWIIALCATRKIPASALRHKQLELDSRTFARSGDLFREHLQAPMSRPDIFAMLQRHGIATDGQRGYHILVYHGQCGLIVLGPMSGRQPTVVLHDAWVRDPVRLHPDEALREFARRYFLSHGPATIHDFARWTGLTLTDARRGHESIRGLMQDNVAMDALQKSDVPPLLLLAGFDEYLLGYKDRSAVLPAAHAGKVVPGMNGMFKAMLVEHGEVTGVWSKTAKAKGVEVELAFFARSRRRLKAQIDVACERYATFLGVPLLKCTMV